jgi:chemotaxis protein MotD
VSIPVASDPVLPLPSRPEPNRSASRQADAPFEQLLEAAAPSAKEAKPPEAPKASRRKDTHGEDVREARSNRPESRDEPSRTKGHDKAPPPEKQTEAPTETAPEGESAAAANEGTLGEPTDQAPTGQETAGQETSNETLPTGEDVTAILDGAPATPETPALDAIAVAPPPVVAPQPEPAPVIAIAVAVTAPAALAAAASDGPAVDPLTGGASTAATTTAAAAAAATATAAAATAAATAATKAAAEAAPAALAKPVATADADADVAFAALVTGETEAKTDKAGKAPTATVAGAAGNERPAQPAADAAPETDRAPARPTQETAPAAPQPAAAKDAPAPAPQDNSAATAKADAPAAQATQTPNIPLPSMGPTAMRVASNPALAVPVSGLAVEIVTRVQNGEKSFEIRLDPAELGRVDVRLDVDKAGNVTTRLTVERPETLDMLRRDSATLERALQQAGLKTEGGLEFNLRDQSQAHRDQSQRDQDGQQSRIMVPDEEPVAPEALRRGYGRMLGLTSGVDIRV